MAANFAALPKSSPFGRAGEEQSDETERVSLSPRGELCLVAVNFAALPKSSPFGRAGAKRLRGFPCRKNTSAPAARQP